MAEKGIVVPGNMQSTNETILKDIDKEDRFLEMMKEKITGIKREKDLILTVYEEQLNQLVRMRVDAELYNFLILSEPSDQKHLQEKVSNERALRVKRRMIEIIREQILQIARAEK
jgi:hypothetical protein